MPVRPCQGPFLRSLEPPFKITNADGEARMVRDTVDFLFEGGRCRVRNQVEGRGSAWRPVGRPYARDLEAAGGGWRIYHGDVKRQVLTCMYHRMYILSRRGMSGRRGG